MAIRRRPAAGARVAWLLVGPVLATGLAGCERTTTAEARVPPPPTVTAVEVKGQDVPIEVDTIGTTRSLQQVIVRARISGFLREKHFEEGSNVHDGQLLLVFDKAPYQAAFDAAKAKRVEAEASLKAAEASKKVEIAAAKLKDSQARLETALLNEARSRRLLERGTESREQYDLNAAALLSARAEVESFNADLLQAKVDFQSNIELAKANLEKTRADEQQAALDLEYCEIYATVDGRKGSPPVHGRVGELKVTVGNYVDPLSQAELVSIQQLDPMGVDIQPSSRYLPEITVLVQQNLQIRLAVQGDRPYPYPGKITFIDNTVNPTTSTFLLRASVPNPDETLLPGDYVKVYITIGAHRGALAVPEEAVIETQAGPVVYVVDAKNQVAIRPVTPIDDFRGLRVIEEGLKAGEKVIVEGLQLVRPGQTVQASLRAYQAREAAAPTRSEDIRKRMQAVQNGAQDASKKAAEKAPEAAAPPAAEKAPDEPPAEKAAPSPDPKPPTEPSAGKTEGSPAAEPSAVPKA